jgi:rhodanese-related sulfurtransferase
MTSTLTPIDPRTLEQKLKRGELALVDIREADEYAREHISHAISLPLSRLEQGRVDLDPRGGVVFTCRTGMRTSANCDRLAAHVEGQAYVLEGGLEAWKKAGLAVTANRKAPLEIMRQVQIIAGGLVLTGAILAATVDPAFIVLSGVMGAGLLFAGASGWCGMAKLLSLAPWNRSAT